MRRICILAAALCFAAPAYGPAYAQAPVQAAVQAAVQAPSRSFVVFFETWSGALDSQAQSIIQAAATAAKAAPSDAIVVTGTSDPTGTARANSLVSALRAQQVADALTDMGVSAGRISQVAYGSAEYALAGIESRRVVIAIGAK